MKLNEIIRKKKKFLVVSSKKRCFVIKTVVFIRRWDVMISWRILFVKARSSLRGLTLILLSSLILAWCCSCCSRIPVPLEILCLVSNPVLNWWIRGSRAKVSRVEVSWVRVPWPVLVQEGTHHVPVVQCEGISFRRRFMKPELKTDV